MTAHDGNGWARCGRGHRHWGRHGAAGLLVGVTPAAGAEPVVLLQRRSWWGNHGGTWGPPGGARDSHEPAVAAALREAGEECGVPAGAVSVHGVLREEHGGWTYETVVATAPAAFQVRAGDEETSAAAWVAAADVPSRRLHPGFAGQWPLLRQALVPLTLVVDAANVIGSRPDGWWRDRAGAARRMARQLGELASRGVTGVPAQAGVPALDIWFPEVILVVEGAAREAAEHDEQGCRDDQGHPELSRTGSQDGLPASGAFPGSGAGRVRLAAAPGSGDDEIARLARLAPGHRLVVTADRELRARSAAAGAAVAGPRWLLDQL